VAEVTSLALDASRLVHHEQAETTRHYECLACGAAVRLRRARWGEQGFEHVGAGCVEAERHSLAQAVLRLVALRRTVRVPGALAVLTAFDVAGGMHQARQWMPARTVTTAEGKAPAVLPPGLELDTADGVAGVL